MSKGGGHVGTPTLDPVVRPAVKQDRLMIAANVLANT